MNRDDELRLNRAVSSAVQRVASPRSQTTGQALAAAAGLGARGLDDSQPIIASTTAVWNVDAWDDGTVWGP